MQEKESHMAGLEGTTLGHYRLQRLLGRGGMSEVYLARDEAMHRTVAIKVIGGHHADYLERFRREAEAMDRLSHDHILPAYDYDEEQPWYYLVMLYTPFGTLRDRIAAGPLPPEEAAEILDQIASALQFAHDHGIIHRDIKPSNILLRDKYYAYLADFGLAKTLEHESELTQTGSLLGTPEYMAPDLADGAATASSDIYALGVMLYQMVTGKVPFTGETPVAIYWKHLREQPAPPSQVNPTLWTAIDTVILRALEKDPRRRFASATALAAAYRQALDAPRIYRTKEAVRTSTAAYASTTASRKADPAGSAPPGRTDPRLRGPASRIILPGNPFAFPSPAPSRSKRPTPDTPAALPPLPMRAVPAQEPVTAPPIATPPTTKAEPPRNSRLVFSIIVIGLLLFVGLPMGLSYFAYSMRSSSSTPARALAPTHAPQGLMQVTPPLPTRQQATNTAAIATRATSSTPILLDPLNENTAGRWNEDATNCTFPGSGYLIHVHQSDFLQPCKLFMPTMNNATAVVDVSLQAGNNAGMLLRLQGEQFYDFEITNQNQFFFRRHDSGGGANYVTLISASYSSAIAPEGQKNTLLAIANGSNFKFYINGTFVGEVQDTSYPSGQFALATGTLAPLTTGQASFANVKIYAIP